MSVGEFFSGIGAMHLALEEALNGTPHPDSFKVTTAFDINQIANQTYEHNFKELKVTTKLVEHLPVEYFERLDLKGWLMSPPCQPFTRGGNLLDDKDDRSVGLLHMIKVLEEMKNPPKYLFLENVLNFESSRCRERLVEVLRKRNYVIEEYLVSPVCLGIPNDRLRYYLIACRQESQAHFTGKIIRTLPVDGPCESKKIQDYLDRECDPSFDVPLRYITDYKQYKHDVVHPLDTRSTTFTKAYGSKYIIGTGSFLQTKRLVEMRDYPKDDPQVLQTLGLRFFTPDEVARLHCFPGDKFSFPDSITRLQRYRLLGNSMNVRVVAYLLKRLFTEEIVNS